MKGDWSALLEALDLGPQDGVMLYICRADGSKEVRFPQLGLMTEARIEQGLMLMYRGLLQARAVEHKKSMMVEDQEENDDVA